MQRACAILAQQAESLAGEINRGEIADSGGADALRMLAHWVRLARLGSQPASGHA